MLFASIQFLLFVIIVFAIYYVVPKQHRKIILLLAAGMFLISFSPSYLIYSFVFVVVNYLTGIGIAFFNGHVRAILYYTGQAFNILGLVIYKYLDFVIDNTNFFLASVFDWQLPHVEIIVPIGISYYTFQGVSYLYLVYKAKDVPESNILDFLLYMLFWPKLLAGPIERHRTFLPQTKNYVSFDYARIVSGLRLFMWGLFKKAVVGDTFAIIISKVYGNIEVYQGIPLLLTFMIQPVQIYCDFSGYTDMALGLAKIFGYKLTDNFKRPFMARSVGDFWRRWHISLSSWCSDFIYNRLLLKHRKWGDKAVVYAIFVSFTVIGIWHGAKWTYVFLGFMQVIALTYEFMTRRWRNSMKTRTSPFLHKWFSRGLVYLFFSASLVFFFADSLSDVVHFYKYLFIIENITNTSFGFNIVHTEFYLAVLLGAVVLMRDVLIEDKPGELQLFQRIRDFAIPRWTLYLIWMLCVVYFSKNQAHFVYMQF
ncbi:MAG: MBOAT family protein [Marinilabiliaceae bacterium]|nr:MBOAT family protein [Marinilabiliaceae bacterium]